MLKGTEVFKKNLCTIRLNKECGTIRNYFSFISVLDLHTTVPERNTKLSVPQALCKTTSSPLGENVFEKNRKISSEEGGRKKKRSVSILLSALCYTALQALHRSVKSSYYFLLKRDFAEIHLGRVCPRSLLWFSPFMKGS